MDRDILDAQLWPPPTFEYVEKDFLIQQELFFAETPNQHELSIRSAHASTFNFNTFFDFDAAVTDAIVDPLNLEDDTAIFSMNADMLESHYTNFDLIPQRRADRLPDSGILATFAPAPLSESEPNPVIQPTANASELWTSTNLNETSIERTSRQEPRWGHFRGSKGHPIIHPNNQTLATPRKSKLKMDQIPGYSCFELERRPKKSTFRRQKQSSSKRICLRCRLQKLECSGGNPCSNCTHMFERAIKVNFRQSPPWALCVDADIVALNVFNLGYNKTSQDDGLRLIKEACMEWSRSSDEAQAVSTERAADSGRHLELDVSSARHIVLRALDWTFCWYIVSSRNLLSWDTHCASLEAASQKLFAVLKEVLTRRKLEKATVQEKLTIALVIHLIYREVYRWKNRWKRRYPNLYPQEKGQQLLLFLYHQQRILEGRNDLNDWGKGLIPNYFAQQDLVTLDFINMSVAAGTNYGSIGVPTSLLATYEY